MLDNLTCITYSELSCTHKHGKHVIKPFFPHTGNLSNSCNYRWHFLCFVLSYLHSQIHHPQDTVLGMDEQAPPIWMELQHVDGDTAQVPLINFLPRENMQSFTFHSDFISTCTNGSLFIVQ